MFMMMAISQHSFKANTAFLDRFAPSVVGRRKWKSAENQIRNFLDEGVKLDLSFIFLKLLLSVTYFIILVILSKKPRIDEYAISYFGGWSPGIAEVVLLFD